MVYDASVAIFVNTVPTIFYCLLMFGIPLFGPTITNGYCFRNVENLEHISALVWSRGRLDADTD